MEARFLLDTNTCIYVRRRKPSAIMVRFQGLQPGEAALSVITYGELSLGAEKSVTPQDAFRYLQEFTDFVPVLPLPEEAGRAYGEVRAALESKGEVIGANDLWIAAHAMAAQLILVTNNEREFRRVRGLRIENWVK
jgi:tRNA(fMet)-specific endonuclease VapC